MDAPVFEAVHFSDDVAPALGTLAHVHASHVENQAAPPNTDATEPLRCGAPFVMTTKGPPEQPNFLPHQCSQGATC
jgi:hypothetical protein